MSKNFNISGFTFLRKQKGRLFVNLAFAQTKANKGFTLIELLVAIVIIVILSVIGIASFNTANSRNEVSNQAKEIESLLRLLRTNSVAALKPQGPCTTNGAVYGTYANIKLNTDTITHGVSCWSPESISPAVDYSTQETYQLKDGLHLGFFGIDNFTIFFDFDGNIRYFDFTTLPALVAPTRDQILNPPSAPIELAFSVEITKIVVSNTDDIQTGTVWSVAVNRSGLICDESITLPLTNVNTLNSTCANNPP